MSAAARERIPQGSLASSSGGVAMEDFDRLTAFFREERAHLEQKRQEADAKFNAEVADLRRELDKQRQEADAKSNAETADLRRRLGEQQLMVLHVRLERLHEAKLLDDEALFLAEDAIADSEDATAGERVSKLFALSTKMSSDRAFARQLKRLFAK